MKDLLIDLWRLICESPSFNSGFADSLQEVKCSLSPGLFVVLKLEPMGEPSGFPNICWLKMQAVGEFTAHDETCVWIWVSSRENSRSTSYVV